MLSRITMATLSFVGLLAARLFGPPEPADARRGDRGDVPGWVMITVMTAIVVIALLVVFREQVLDAVRNAFQDVRNSGNGQDT